MSDPITIVDVILWTLLGLAIWAACRFRPVQTRKSDISIFTAMLNGARERERA